jgi:hypothetical protein
MPCAESEKRDEIKMIEQAQWSGTCSVQYPVESNSYREKESTTKYIDRTVTRTD